MVEAIARQLDRCDVCGTKIHKHKLVRSNMDFLAAAGQNHFAHSSYHTDAWALTNGTDSGVISIGPYADRARVSISDDNTRTEILGSQTWTVSDPISVYQGLVRIHSVSLDLSAYTSLVVSFDWGFYQQEQNPDGTAYVLIYDYSGTNGNITRKYMRSSGGRYWQYIPISDISSSLDLTDVKLYIIVGTHSGGEKVWIDRMQLEKDVTKMGTFIPTSGSSVDRIDTRMMTVRKVCPNCREPVLSRSERYGRVAELRTEEPIALDIQEV